MYPPPHHSQPQTLYVLPIAYNTPQSLTQPLTEFPQMDSGLVVPIFNQGDDPIACLNKAMAFLTVIASSKVTVQQAQRRQGQSYAGNSYKGNASSSGGNNIGGQEKVVKCYNCQGEGHMARQCTQPKRPRNAAWFKEKAKMAEAPKAGQIVDEEQLAFLADPCILDVGYQNPYYLKKAQRIKPTLYDGSVISSQHVASPVIADEETLILEELQTLHPNTDQSTSSPVKIEAPKELPKVNIDDPNITMEEYIRLEEEKARRNGKVYNWETATYGKIWYNEDVHDLRSVETEFPTIVFDDTFTSDVTPSDEPTVSFLNDNKIDFRISFDESDDEDYTVIYDENSFSYKIISVNNLKMDYENNDDKVNMPSFLSPEPKINYSNDLDFFKDFEKEFPAIVYNDDLTSKSDFSTEPTLCPQHIDEFNLKDETSLYECDEKEQNVLYFNDLFPFNIYKDQFDSIKKTRALSKEAGDSLIAQLNFESLENADLKRQIQDKVFVITSLKNDLRKLNEKETVKNATQIPIATTIAPGIFKLDLDTLDPRMGYGDYQLGNIIISRVYYVEGHGHNLFFAGQNYDADLEVAFRKNTCFIWNLEGVDLLLGSRDINLYTISLDDMLKTSSIRLLSKASKTKSWLWHHQLSHLNFGIEESPKTPHFHDDPLHESLHEDSTSQGSSSNVRQSHTPLKLIGRWTKDHPIANVIEDPSRSVSTRKQLKNDAMWCYFNAFPTYVEPKNFKQAMTEPSGINAIQNINWLTSSPNPCHEKDSTSRSKSLKIKDTAAYRFNLDKKKCRVDIEELGYSGKCDMLSAIHTDHMHQPWRTLAAIINRKATPKKERKFKKVVSPSKKLPPILEKEPNEKPKRAKKPAKKSTTAPTTGVVIRDTPVVFVPKKKAPTKAYRGKGMDLLSEAALLKAA
nr:retrovirus-related Pol polyprotein from transposon TNT 1-94 [Tanacetum cinerariifolium]